MGGVSSLEVNGIEVYKLPDYQEFLNVTNISINDFLNKVCIAETFNDNQASNFIGKTITGISNTYDSSSNVDWEIIDYNHDSTSGTFDLMAKKSIKDSKMFRNRGGTSNSNYTYNTNYEYSEIRTWLQSYVNNFSSTNSSLYNRLTIMNIIYNFNTKQPNNQLYFYGSTGDGTTSTTGNNRHIITDRIKLLSCTELGYSGSGIDTMPDTEGIKYAKFSSFSSRTNNSDIVRNNTSGSATFWWLRSRLAGSARGEEVWCVGKEGLLYSSSTNNTYSVVPVIRISV